jgi:hypothetical protein
MTREVLMAPTTTPVMCAGAPAVSLVVTSIVLLVESPGLTETAVPESRPVASQGDSQVRSDL